MKNIYDDTFREMTHDILPGEDWRKFKAQGIAESNLLFSAISPASAIGVMQIMPSTGKDLGYSVEDLKDPEKNIDAGITYMKMMYKFWKNISDNEERWRFALASYNAGMGNIRSAMRRANREGYVTDVWSCVSPFLKRVTGKHSKETINYVARVEKFYKKLLTEG